MNHVRVRSLSQVMTLVTLVNLGVCIVAGYDSDFNSPYTLTDALLREVVAKMGEDELLQMPLERRVIKDDEEQERRLSDADYEDPLATMIRDQEYLQHSSLWGHQYVAGGAGEGKQRLKPDGSIKNVHEVKSDSVLPAYCDPPNPCPVGYTGDEDCLDNFVNTAEFSRQYQSSQDCMCDTEHMFDCPSTSRQDEINALAQSIQNEGLSDQAIDKIMENLQGQHKSLVAKKHHNPSQLGYLRDLRSMTNKHRASVKEAENPYLKGEKLPIVAKKGSNILM